MLYRIAWEIDLHADTPEAAAQLALTIQRHPASLATVFDVTDEAGETVRVDLTEVDERNQSCPMSTPKSSTPGCTR